MQGTGRCASQCVGRAGGPGPGAHARDRGSEHGVRHSGPHPTARRAAAAGPCQRGWAFDAPVRSRGWGGRGARAALKARIGGSLEGTAGPNSQRLVPAPLGRSVAGGGGRPAARRPHRRRNEGWRRGDLATRIGRVRTSNSVVRACDSGGGRGRPGHWRARSARWVKGGPDARWPNSSRQARSTAAAAGRW